MNRKYFVIKFITHNIRDDNPIIYQYIKGGDRSKETAVRRLTEIIYQSCNEYWFNDPLMTLSFVRGVCREYLSFTNTLYLNGEINLKSIYQNF